MNIKEQAQAYEPKTTKNISELEMCRVDAEVKERIVHEGEEDEFKYKYIEIDGEEYRVPDSVLKQLKAQLEENEDLMFFKVKKDGSGINTNYTVIPLSEKIK